MKLTERFDPFRADADPLSVYLSEFRFEADYFTHWPQQDFKTLKNLVSTRIKLVLQTQGNAELTTRSEHFTLAPGSVMLIPPYCVYSASTFDHVDSYEIFFNLHPYAREHGFLQQFGFTRILHFPRILSPADIAALESCYEDMRAHRPGGYAQLGALMQLLFLRLIRLQNAPALPAENSSREQYVISRLFEYLETHLAQPIHVDQLCAALHVSQSHLYRCSRNVMNCSTQQLVIRYKLRHAQMLLKNPELSIGDVAGAIGYDLFYFSTQFKKAFLVSPSQYRKNLLYCLQNA
ncbi:MAG TPA: helix-turn-helix transcriptional regulator [Candidatus Limiplasma pullicola]|nr:helix-turn-helix transcriptional regulator [Candidatus Limiplasma pullicola]